jgi:hypothetical protein
MMMGGMAQGTRQGAGIELMEFVVRRKVTEPAQLPTSLPAGAALTRQAAERERTFRFARPWPAPSTAPTPVGRRRDNRVTESCVA